MKMVFTPAHNFDKPLSLSLSKLFKNNTIIDLGCGWGDYIKQFKNIGILCDGFGGNPYTTEMKMNG